MQKDSKGFLANGGLILLIGVVLAVASIVVSGSSIFASVDPFKLLTGQDATFQLGGAGVLIALVYYLVVVGMICVGAYRLLEHANAPKRDEDGSRPQPPDPGGLHPV